MKLVGKGLLTFMLLILVSGGALAQAPDVPPDHWAYDAVRTLLERGYLDAEADGLFRGDDPVSRFTLAGVVARLLDDIEAGRVQIGTAVDVEMLRRLEGEFRAELVAWYAAREELEAANAQTQRQIAVIDEQLNNILFALEEIDLELQTMEAADAERDARLDGHDRGLAELRDQFAQAYAELEAAVDEFYGSVVTVLGEQSEAVDRRLEEQMDAVADMIAGVQSRIETEVLPYVDDLDRRLSNQLADHAAAAFLQMAEMDERHTEQLNELASELASVRNMTAELGTALEDLGVVLSTEYREELDKQAAGFSQAIETVRGETERLDGAVRRLEEQVEANRAAAEAQRQELDALMEMLSQQTDELAGWIARVEEQSAADLDNTAAELRAMVSVLGGTLEELRNNLQTVERHTAVLTDAVMDAMAETAALRDDVDALSARMNTEQDRMRADLDAVQEELRMLQGVLGTSEDQINALAERVMQQLEEQLALQLARERQLTRQLEDLQAEFNSYRVKTDEELQSARNMGTLGIGAAILAIVLGFAQ